MKYAVRIGSGAMIYISSFIKTGSSIQKADTWTQQGDRTNLFLFFQNEGRRLNKTITTTLTFPSYVALYYPCAERRRKRRSEFHETLSKEPYSNFGQNRTSMTDVFMQTYVHFRVILMRNEKKKGKAILVTGRGGP
jgi:hypothetical protein